MKRRKLQGTACAVLSLAFLLLPTAPVALGWDKDACQSYADTWATSCNPDFPNWVGSGGDCTNYVSQCLHAHDVKDSVPGDPVIGVTPPSSALNGPGIDEYFAGGTGTDNGWYCLWVTNNGPDHWSPAHAWTLAADLHSYMKNNSHFSGPRYLVGNYDFKASTDLPAPPLNNTDLDVGDVISYDEDITDNGGDFDVDHLAIVVRNNSHSRWQYPDLFYNNDYQGDLVSQHSSYQDRVDWSKKDVYAWSGSAKYDPSVRVNWQLAAWGISGSLD